MPAPPRAPYRREPALSPGSRARLCPTLDAERLLTGFLARLSADERRAFWLGVLILDGSVTVGDASEWWRGQHPEPAVDQRSKGCVVCGAEIPARRGRPRVTCGAEACQTAHYGHVKHPAAG